ncbi:MAG: lamin tail domain-containing protein [Bacteroidota bacterium]
MKLRIVPLWLYLFFFTFIAQMQAQQVVINEIMFAPATGGNEWVELFNPGDREINIREWKLQDKGGGSATLSTGDVSIPAGGYLLIASGIPLAPGWETPPAPVLAPGNFPSLNNSGDEVILRDSAGNTVDSVAYTGSWSAQKGVTAERLRHDLPPLRENWSACIAQDGGTPGEQNSVSVPPIDPLPRYTLIINEIMPAPFASSCEWLELYNPGASAMDLSRWSIAGKMDSRGNRSLISLPADAGEISPLGYALIAADSSVLQYFPGLPLLHEALMLILDRSSLELSNTDDEILLLDPTGACIDSIWYSEDWHHPFLSSSTGVSLELMQPGYHHLGSGAWSSCVASAGGTPGIRNSIYTEEPLQSRQNDVTLEASPNPFSPDGDGHEDFCLFRFRLPANVNQVRLRIYDVEGRQVATVLNNQAMGREGSIVWNGLDDSGRRMRVGAYVALLEGLDPASNIVIASKTVVVVARQL